jgi:predicted nucleic acid-binding protein
MFLLDSNILIYATQPHHVALRAWLTQQQQTYISAISYIEVLGYHKLQKPEEQALSTLLSCFETLYPSPTTIHIATGLRRQFNMSLGDALVAATASEYRLTLATANTKDFERIQNFSVINPLMTP